MNTPQTSIIDQIADERDQLRDENFKLKRRIELVEAANSDVARIAKERDDALMMLGLYRMKSDEQKERIKRLEEYETRLSAVMPIDFNERDELRQENQRLRESMEIMMSAVSHVARIAKERDDANERINQLVLALRRIANTDYRGNRSIESQIAAEALESKP